jgi:hypothetical protein
VRGAQHNSGDGDSNRQNSTDIHEWEADGRSSAVPKQGRKSLKENDMGKISGRRKVIESHWIRATRILPGSVIAKHLNQ